MLTPAQQRKLREASQRWFDLPERVKQHQVISRYRSDLVRFKTVHAGRRSFKTEIAKRVLVVEAMANTGVNLFFGAPTNLHAKGIAWKHLKQLAGPVIKNHSESELWIEVINGSTIHVVGFDKPERFEGRLWHGGVLDELSDMHPTVWLENVRPALSDTGGWCWLIGVPGGKNHYYELSQYAKQSGDPQWADYSWFSADTIDPAEVEQARAQYDERTFRQEYEGSFESYEGRAYVYYDSEKHRKPQFYSSRHSLCISCDFNLDPCIWIIGQDKDGFISIQDEIKQRQTDVWKMCGELKRRLEQRAGKDCRKHAVIFYGDYEHGKSRSVSAVASSWQIIRDEFVGWSVEFRYKPHPRILDRINSVNSKLRTTRGDIQLGLDPACVELHKDFEMVDLEMLRSPEKKSQAKDRTHASDNLGYWMDYEYPIRKAIVEQY